MSNRKVNPYFNWLYSISCLELFFPMKWGPSIRWHSLSPPGGREKHGVSLIFKCLLSSCIKWGRKWKMRKLESPYLAYNIIWKGRRISLAILEKTPYMDSAFELLTWSWRQEGRLHVWRAARASSVCFRTQRFLDRLCARWILDQLPAPDTSIHRYLVFRF